MDGVVCIEYYRYGTLAYCGVQYNTIKHISRSNKCLQFTLVTTNNYDTTTGGRQEQFIGVLFTINQLVYF